VTSQGIVGSHESIFFSKVNQSGLWNFSGCANCRTLCTEHTVFEYLVIIRKVPAWDL